jgi:hypothetical protein
MEGMRSFTTPRSALAPTARGAAEESVDSAELPPLGEEEVEKLKTQLDTDPEAVLAWARSAYDAELTEDQLRITLMRAQAALQSPHTFIKVLDAMAEHDAALAVARGAVRVARHLLPPGFAFPGMTEDIPIDPTNAKFETRDDAISWVLFAGPYWLRTQFGGITKAPFRWHNHPDYQAKRFVYHLEDPTVEAPLEIALVSDFGTGLYPALYTARQFERKRYPYAIHLGDVYYAGRKSEFLDNFEIPLNPILGSTRLFMLNGNHEMMAGAQPYFDYIDLKRTSQPTAQEQEGSYFCLRSSRFQLVGIDTDYHEHGRLKQPELVEWLESILREGRRERRTNILLSSNEPYEYGKASLQPLLTEDLARAVSEQLIDVWLWGNTHYCALFDAGPQTPFIGSCIGHGGYPYSRKQAGERSPAPIRFVETRARFPAWTELRQDRGNNGYCLLRLHADGTVALNYIDWMSNLRCETTLSQANAQGRLTISGVQMHA